MDVAISAELTLSGRLLPVGGIKEKILAARRAGLKTVILPSRNKSELGNIPENIQNDMKIIFADKIEDVIDMVLTKQ